MGSQLDYRNNLEGSNGQIDIDLSQYQSGIYFIEVKTQQANEVIKIQKD
jgi:Holliday junction resolvase-like predicted endonuclease